MLIISMEVIIKREGRIVVKEVFGFRGNGFGSGLCWKFNSLS
jgi:hypothetical protein